MPAKPLSVNMHRQIHKMIGEGKTRREIADYLGVSQGTVSNFARRPVPQVKEEVREESGLPKGIEPKPTNYAISTPGTWLVISDLHIPYHHEQTIMAAVDEARERKAVGVVINGDLLDCYQLSRFDKNPSKPKLVEEINATKQFFGWLRTQLPSATVVWKEGNHEERLFAYLDNNAAALFGLEALQWSNLLALKDNRIDHVGDRMRIDLGKLPIVHGHEFFRGFAPPVNPARGLYLRAKSSAMCGHHHQTSHHRERDVKGRETATWSLGCACQLAPDYARFSNWNHGFAFVELAKDGTYSVHNLTYRNGRIEG